MAGVGHLQRICKDACRVAGAVQETCSWEMLGGQWQVQHFVWPGVTFAWQAQHFTLYTDGVEQSQNVLVRGRQLCTQLSIFEGSLAELLSFWWCALYILTWKCAARHNGVHLFDIAASKSGPMLVCFVHFDLEMCFVPQRRATFHLSSGQMAPHPPL